MQSTDNVMKKLIIVLLLLIFTVSVTAQEFPNYYDKYVNDFVHLFNESDTQQLRATLSDVESATSAEVVVVTVNTTAPLTPAEYRTELFNLWKIGKKEKDNGLLILYSLQENRIEVETGYGLEGILPDSKLGRFLDEIYVPYRDEGKVTQGIILFAEEAAGIINENKEGVLAGPKSGLTGYQSYIFVAIMILFLIFLIAAVKGSKVKCKKDGLPMKCIGRMAGGIAGGYALYKCAKGHTTRINRSYFWYGGGMGGGAGGFGGFGGGASGGGGAGR